MFPNRAAWKVINYYFYRISLKLNLFLCGVIKWNWVLSICRFTFPKFPYEIYINISLRNEFRSSFLLWVYDNKQKKIRYCQLLAVFLKGIWGGGGGGGGGVPQ